MVLTALRIVSLNEIVEQHVRPDPLRGLLRSLSLQSQQAREGESEHREPSFSHMWG